MMVLLLQNVPGLGKKGEIVKVKEGYARNYLFPNNLAQPVTESLLKRLEHEKKIKEDVEKRQVEKAIELKKRLEESPIRVPIKVGEKGKAYGSLTSQHLEKIFKSLGYEAIKKNMIEIEEPIKSVGNYTISIRLHPKVKAKVRLEVFPIEE